MKGGSLGGEFVWESRRQQRGVLKWRVGDRQEDPPRKGRHGLEYQGPRDQLFADQLLYNKQLLQVLEQGNSPVKEKYGSLEPPQYDKQIGSNVSLSCLGLHGTSIVGRSVGQLVDQVLAM